MTDEMLALARGNAAAAGVENAEFLRGNIEELPLPDASVDVVISNCVINLSGDKPRVLREAARMLRPGGRFAVSDVIADPDMDAATRADMAQRTAGIAGARHARVRARPPRRRPRRHRDPRDPPRPRPRRLRHHPRQQAGGRRAARGAGDWARRARGRAQIGQRRAERVWIRGAGGPPVRGRPPGPEGNNLREHSSTGARGRYMMFTLARARIGPHPTTDVPAGTRRRSATHPLPLRLQLT